MKSYSLLSCSVCLTAALALSGCETPGDTAFMGAATGAAIGGLLHGKGEQALAGAAIGAGAGYLAGKVVQNERRRSYEEGYYQGRATPSQPEPRYPMGRPTRTSDLVISPYAPHNLIDVRGIPSGARVVDPSCDRVFINP